MGRNPNRSLIRKLLSSIDKLYGPEGFSYQGKENPKQILKKLDSAVHLNQLGLPGYPGQGAF
jgi:hypothetical protein